MTPSTLLRPLAVLLALAAPALLGARETPDPWKTGQQKKEISFPDKIARVPDGNDFDDPDSDYSHSRMLEGPNVAIFWHKEYGDVPMNHPDAARRFNPYRMLEETERYYRFYVDELEYVKKGESVSDGKKLLVFVYGGDGGTAFGGGSGDVGIFWTPAVRVNQEPYGVIAHELAHSFQFMSRLDCGTGAGGGVNEMAAQYFLWQVLPAWQTFENYHLRDFMKKTHRAFMHPTNIYHSPYVIEYWSGLHGRTFWGELNRRTRRGEDVVQTYKRLRDLSQDEFNDEMFDGVRRFITWDLPRVQETSKPYRNQHRCELIPAGDGWFRIAPDRVPQNYGYNGIRLDVPAAGTKVGIRFRGLAGEPGYESPQSERAGWRYGFVAYKRDETRVYSEAFSGDEGSFTVPEGTEFLWLVVMGAPTEHFPVASGPRRGGSADASERPEEAWPYQVRLSGTSIADDFVADGESTLRAPGK